MNTKKSIIGSLIVATVLLAAMGCWFCWHCPSRFYETHELFWRQLAWNGVGIAAFAGAWALGWRRLLKAAPWLMAAWLAAFAAAHFARPVNGAHKWIRIGPIAINVVTCFMPVFALFVAWLHYKKRIAPCMELAAVAVAILGAAWYVIGSDWRVARLSAFFDLSDGAQDGACMGCQLVAAFDAANWFGCAGERLDSLPCPESDGMMSAAALLFGKWFPVAVIVSFAAIGALLSIVLRNATDVARRRFVILFGLWLIVSAAYCFLHSIGLFPVAGMSPALASYGGTAVVMAWFGLGATVSMDKDGSQD